MLAGVLRAVFFGRNIFRLSQLTNRGVFRRVDSMPSFSISDHKSGRIVLIRTTVKP